MLVGKKAGIPTWHDLLSGKHLLLNLLSNLGRNEEVVGGTLPWLKLLTIGIKRLIEVIVWWLEGRRRKRSVLRIKWGPRPS